MTTPQKVAEPTGKDSLPVEPVVGQATPEGRTARERFDALTDRQKDKIFDEYRNWNVHEGWYDTVYEDFRHDMAKIGIEVDDIYYSGFSSKGDGACFEGCVSDWPKFLESVGRTCPALTALATKAWRLYVVHRGHYFHENCTAFTIDMVRPGDYCYSEQDEFIAAHSPYDNDIQNAAFMALLQGYDFDKLEDEFMEAFKDHMRDLYSRLEEEHDYLTSDEAILDSLEGCEQLEEAINSIIEESEPA